MANALYDKGRKGFLDGGVDWSVGVIKVVLCSAGYLRDLAAHEFLSDIPASARVKTSGALTGKTSTDGVADADDVTIPSVTGSTVTQLVLYKDTGTEGTSRLIGNIDTAMGLPFVPNGTNVVVQWANGTNKIFKL